MAIDPYANCNYDILGYLCTLETCCLAQSSFLYRASLPANLFFTILFGALIIPQLYVGVKHRTWGYMSAMLLGLAFEVIGYVGRVQLHVNPFNALGFYMYLIALTIAPVFMTAAIYLCLARIIGLFGPHLCRLKPRTISSGFMVSDFISLLLQAAGGAFAATTDGYSSGRIGANIMIGGLLLQVVSLAMFLLVCADFAWRCHKGVLSADPEHSRVRQRRLFITFCVSTTIATVAILIRSIFRTAELWQGFSGKLWNDETTFLILDGAMVGLACVLLSFFHPALAFGKQWAEVNWTFRSRKEKTEITSSY